MSFDAGSITGKIVLNIDDYRKNTKLAEADAATLATAIDRTIGEKAPAAAESLAKSVEELERSMQDLPGAQDRITESQRQLAASAERADDSLRDAAAGTEKLETAIEDLTPAQKRAKDEFDAMRTKLDQLDSSLKQVGPTAKNSGEAIGGLLKGAGEVAAVTMAAKEIEKFGNAVQGLQTKLASGEIDKIDALSESLRNVPVLGDMTKAFDSLGGAISGATAEMAKLNAESERMQITSDAVAKLLDSKKNTKDAFKDKEQSTNPDQDLLDEAERRRAEVDQVRADRRAQLAKKRLDAGGWFRGPESAEQLEAEQKMTDKAAAQANAEIEKRLKEALDRRARQRAAANPQAESQVSQAERYAQQVSYPTPPPLPLKNIYDGWRAMSGASQGINVGVNIAALDQDAIAKIVAEKVSPLIEQRVAIVEHGMEMERYRKRTKKGYE